MDWPIVPFPKYIYPLEVSKETKASINKHVRYQYNTGYIVQHEGHATYSSICYEYDIVNTCTIYK